VEANVIRRMVNLKARNIIQRKKDPGRIYLGADGGAKD
jgi:hypothetical protein